MYNIPIYKDWRTNNVFMSISNMQRVITSKVLAHGPTFWLLTDEVAY